LIGIDDLVVVDTKDSLLICKKAKSQEVKQIVERIKKEDQ
ncbi:mannose-1-phosphate guanylyltransferase, partial [bacterium]